MVEVLYKKIKSADGHLLPYSQYKPKNNASKCIILLYEIFGLTSHINDLAKEFSNNGFLVNVPDIFSRIESDINLPYNKAGLKEFRLKKN